MRSAMVVFFLVLGLAACGARSIRMPDAGAVETDVDADTDGDTDVDVDSDADMDADTDTGRISCEGRAHGPCVAAFPTCVPVYDDHCCPTCEEGGCGDCLDWRFHHCAPFAESACEPGFVPMCGTTPEWACVGGEADCLPAGWPVCGHDIGCLGAQFQPEDDPNGDRFTCHPIRATTCSRCEGDQSCRGRKEMREGGECDWCIAEDVCH